MSDTISSKTREIYHKQHQRIIQDQVASERLRNMNTEEFFGLGPGWFNGKKTLDAGCGDTAELSIQFSSFGAEIVYGFDLGEEWLESAVAECSRFGIDRNKFFFVPGNVLDIPFDDESFDLVACNGVMCHLENLEEVHRAFSECSRVCKSGGYLYVSMGIGKPGGLFEEAVWPAIREYYEKNPTFKEFIDNISPADFEDIYKKISDDMVAHTGKQAKPYHSDLFDVDLCITIQNLIQAPTRIMLEYSAQDVVDLFNKYGFENIRRLNRYILRNNIRKYLAPLHYDKGNDYSQLLYGDGYLEYIAQKK